MSYKCRYNLIWGERKNGKTYSVLDRILKRMEREDDYTFVYCRRKHRMVVNSKMKDLWAEFSTRCIDTFGSIIMYDGSSQFFIENDGRKVVGYKTCVEDAYIDKGNTFGMKKKVTVLFDEFLDTSYMEDEIKYFQQMIGNIVRNEQTQEVEIFMLGNTVSKYCPYFDFFGIDITKVRQGDVGTIRCPEGGTVAFEYCKSKVQDLDKKKTSEYFGFDNPTSKMILHGQWEYDDCNTKEIDGISWKDKRRIVRAYVTALKNVYEISIHESENPICFVRKVNTQNGIVNKRIEYNISFDNSVKLYHYGDVAIPKYRRISEKFMYQDVIDDFDVLSECIRCGRIVFQTIEIGTEFTVAYNGIK